jgi:hypothetical protein
MMINHASTARTVLATKASRFETARAMGRAHRGPYSPETCRKVSDACRFIKALSSEARRHYLAERKARWLTNCIVERGNIKTFDLAGVDPLTGRRFSVRIEMPLDASLLDFLLLVMRYEGAPAIMRLDAAKNAASLMHERPKPVITVERQQQLECRRERKRQYMRKRYRERLSALAAADGQTRRSPRDDAPRTDPAK